MSEAGVSQAWSRLARTISQALLDFADELDNNPAASVPNLPTSVSGLLGVVAAEDAVWGKVSMDMPWSTRVLRQSLILDAIDKQGGRVTHKDWVAIANSFGYTGRGLAGFFRGGDGGLLQMHRDEDEVSITLRGYDRLHENREAVDAALAAKAA